MSNGSPTSDALQFSFLHFLRFLKENNVFSIAIAAVLSDRINDLVNSMVNSLVMPIINRDANQDGVEDIRKLEDKVVEISGVEFEIGKVLTSIVKFIVVTYFVFVLSRMIRNWAALIDQRLVGEKQN